MISPLYTDTHPTGTSARVKAFSPYCSRFTAASIISYTIKNVLKYLIGERNAEYLVQSFSHEVLMLIDVHRFKMVTIELHTNNLIRNLLAKLTRYETPLAAAQTES